MYNGFHVKCLLHLISLITIGMCRQSLVKITNVKYHENRPI